MSEHSCHDRSEGGKIWTFSQDEELRLQCERAGGDLSLKKIKWWEELARGFPGSSAKGLQQVSPRWMHDVCCMCACVRACVRACMRACVRA